MANISYIGSFAIIMMENSVCVKKSNGSGFSRERVPDRYAIATHVRFDERGWETGLYATASILDFPNQTKSLFCTDYIWKKKISHKYGSLSYIETILRTLLLSNYGISPFIDLNFGGIKIRDVVVGI